MVRLGKRFKLVNIGLKNRSGNKLTLSGAQWIARERSEWWGFCDWCDFLKFGWLFAVESHSWRADDRPASQQISCRPSGRPRRSRTGTRPSGCCAPWSRSCRRRFARPHWWSFSLPRSRRSLWTWRCIRIWRSQTCRRRRRLHRLFRYLLRCRCKGHEDPQTSARPAEGPKKASGEEPFSFLFLTTFFTAFVTNWAENLLEFTKALPRLLNAEQVLNRYIFVSLFSSCQNRLADFPEEFYSLLEPNPDLRQTRTLHEISRHRIHDEFLGPSRQNWHKSRKSPPNFLDFFNFFEFLFWFVFFGLWRHSDGNGKVMRNSHRWRYAMKKYGLSQKSQIHDILLFNI